MVEERLVAENHEIVRAAKEYFDEEEIAEENPEDLMVPPPPPLEEDDDFEDVIDENEKREEDGFNSDFDYLQELEEVAEVVEEEPEKSDSPDQPHHHQYYHPPMSDISDNSESVSTEQLLQTYQQDPFSTSYQPDHYYRKNAEINTVLSTLFSDIREIERSVSHSEETFPMDGPVLDSPSGLISPFPLDKSITSEEMG